MTNCSRTQTSSVTSAAAVELRADAALRPRARALRALSAACLVGLLALGACSDSSDGEASKDDADTSEKEEPSAGEKAASSEKGSKVSEDEDEDDDKADQAVGEGGSSEGRPAASSLMLPTTMEYPAQAPWFNVYRPENLADVEGPLPVIAWANGGCYRSDFTWEPLFERWAAGGFVVLALTEHPEQGAMVQTSIADQAGLIDWAFAQAESKDSPYAGKLDTDRIVAAGNSCGGVTALGLAAQDPRAAAVFVLSGSSGFGAANPAVIGNIAVPVGYIVGGPQDIAGANATSDYDALPNGIPALIVSRFEGDHRTVSTDPAILANEALISLNWMDLALYGRQEAYDELTSETVCSECEPGHFAIKSKHLETLLE
jgi:hypothetical protein